MPTEHDPPSLFESFLSRHPISDELRRSIYGEVVLLRQAFRANPRPKSMGAMKNDETIAKLVTTRPEADIAADLKRRVDEAMVPLAALMDEAATHGLQVMWDNFMVGPPAMRFRVNGLRIVKNY
jgi:hypothetical protein